MSSIREKILAANDRPFEEVATPEWADVGVESVRIITMSSIDRDEFEAAALITRTAEKGTNKLKNLRAELVARCAVDADGKRIFKAEDVEQLGNKSAKVLDRLFSAAIDLNGVTEADMKALEKNSSRGLTGGFSSGLRWLQAASMWTGSFMNFRRNRSTSGAPSSASKATP